ncbi:MAG TPA: cytidine deaminase [Lachnospiraceae bacterium]|nr:cytidine deaminase [Lachnospiraceae bacterium]
MDHVQLIKEALNARKNAYAPYSNYKVGAALLTKAGKVYGGCNVENAAYGPSNCAERTAFFKAVSEGEREFEAIAIVGGYEDKIDSYPFPCGVCRQVMREFCEPSEFKIITAKSEEDFNIHTLEQLLPEGFGPANLHV